MTAIDFVGDIHGHADELVTLLEEQLGYSLHDGYYQHPTRKMFFVGDFIDRGPQIKKVLEIVRPMIDHGAAFTTIGNHEYNAICYSTKRTDGTFLRPHTSRNTGQYEKTISALGDELLDYVEWFKTLPIYFENEYFRVVHAQWKPEYISYLKKKELIDFSNQKFLFASADKTSKEFDAIECLLKGEEMSMRNVPFYDKDGNKRDSYRIKWWLKGDGLECKDALFEFPNDKSVPIAFSGYNEFEIPVFFGHYWLKNKTPLLMSPNVCCLDFSVAKAGKLVAYRWNGERILDQTNFCFVPSKSN